MKKEQEVDEIFSKVSPLVEGLSSNELFTLAGFCVLDLVTKNIGAKNFNGKHKGEVYNEIKSLCNNLEKAIKTSFELSLNGK